MFFCCSCNSWGPAVSVLHFSLIACDQGDKVLGSILAWGAVGTGGQVLPRPSVLRWAISRAFLCGVCMFSPCSQGVSSAKNPNRKNMQKNRTLSCPSLTKMDGSLHLVPGRLRLPTAPGVLEEGQSGMGKCRSQIHGDHGLCVCVCVCPVSPPNICTCVLLCVFSKTGIFAGMQVLSITTSVTIASPKTRDKKPNLSKETLLLLHLARCH